VLIHVNVYIEILYRYLTMIYQRKLSYNKARNSYSLSLPNDFVNGYVKEQSLSDTENIYIEICGQTLGSFSCKVVSPPEQVEVENSQ
jgi:hypothetical protein